MPASLALLTILLSLLGPLTLAVADAGFGLYQGRRYLEARAELEALIEELRGGGLSRRRLQRARARLAELRSLLRRMVVVRLLFLAPVYLAVSLVVLSRIPPIPLPVSCCVPLLTVATEKGCFTLPGLVAAASFLAALPLMQSDLVVAAAARAAAGGALKKGRRGGG